MRAQLAEQSYVTGLPVTEVKIFTYQHSAHMKAAHQDLLDEFFRGESREIEREGKHNGGFQAHGAEPVHALRASGDAEGGRFRTQDLTRGRVEGQRRGDILCFCRAVDGRADDGLMTEMDAVKVPDSEHAAASG